MTGKPELPAKNYTKIRVPTLETYKLPYGHFIKG
jgi:hypothetical protein